MDVNVIKDVIVLELQHSTYLSYDTYLASRATVVKAKSMYSILNSTRPFLLSQQCPNGVNNPFHSWTLNISYVFRDTSNQNKSLIKIKNASCKHVIRKILIRYGLGKIFYSERKGWFMTIVIPTSVHVHTCFDCVSLVGVKLSLLCMPALHFQDGEAHAVFLSALPWALSLAIIQLMPCNSVLSL